MPLIVSKLSADLSNVFSGYPSSGSDAANGIAMAYDNYCKNAIASPGLPIFTTSERYAFRAILSSILSSAEAGNANILAKAFGDAVQAYWMAPPVMFSGGAATGIVTAVPGAMAVVSALAGVLSNTQNTAAVAGQQIAAQLDIATRTVLVTFSTPPPPAGPPPPAMVI